MPRAVCLFAVIKREKGARSGLLIAWAEIHRSRVCHVACYNGGYSMDLFYKIKCA